MLMHGAYHYIDNLARLLLVSRQLFPADDFVLTLRGFTAGPHDQRMRMGNLEPKITGGLPYGETDIVASYALKFRSSGCVLCLGTIALEQTTPGMRSWGPFPEVPYNVNGRLHCTDIHVRLGTAFSIAANVTKYPIQARLGDTDIRSVNSATVVARANARLARTQGFICREYYERPYGNSYSYSAESEIFERWLLDKPTYSDFSSHIPSCAILDGLLKLAADDWRSDVEIDFNYPAPDWPTLPQYDDPWYAYMADNVAFSPET
jgi:hypothetical protein